MMVRSNKMTKSTSEKCLLHSTRQAKQQSHNLSKKYRCECCKGKKHHDYNRQNRLKRESASLSSLTKTCKGPYRYEQIENDKNFINTRLINSIDHYEIQQERSKLAKQSHVNNLSTIKQSPYATHLSKQKKDNSSKHLQEPKDSSPIVDMKSYCKKLFSNSKNQKIQLSSGKSANQNMKQIAKQNENEKQGQSKKYDRFQICLNGAKYYRFFESKEEMKQAVKEVKIIVQKCESKIMKMR